ncbi:LysM peptidoglycan-binding domain-containing protein [Candidatus Microgenomates bacterium]|nr:LysM peptidoglycan-binding domain-containing protein [Candidatus Microgenomates bacterium]
MDGFSSGLGSELGAHDQSAVLTDSRLGFSLLVSLRSLWRKLGEIARSPKALQHGAIIATVAVIVLVGSWSASEGPIAQVAAPPQELLDDSGYGGVVDTTANTYIAANVATQLALPVSQVVNQQVEAINQQVASPTTAEQFPVKPQVVSTAGRTTRNQVQIYTVQSGDTISSLAQRFNITSDTIIWANSLRSESELLPNTQLKILPVNGVLHTVVAGDSPEALAERYQANAAQVVSFNDLEVNGLKAAQEIIIPDGVKPGVANSSVNLARAANFDSPFTPSYGGNGYDYGWCTWWAAERRAQLGRPIPRNWDNAISWRYNAAASGYRVGPNPENGAVAYYKNIGGWGHVGIVEQVSGDGAWFSDMNYPIWGQVTRRFVPASEYGNYSFIY